MPGWTDFFVAGAGAAAALAGLLFVAASINLSRVLQFAQLPLLLAQALLALLTVLAISMVALNPDQSSRALGLQIVALGALSWIGQTISLVRSLRLRDRHSRRVLRVFLNQMPAWPFVVAGLVLVSGGRPGGWIVAGTLLSFLTGVSSAWILLIEIHR